MLLKNMESIFRKYEIQSGQGKKNEDLPVNEQEESKAKHVDGENENMVGKRNINSEILIKDEMKKYLPPTEMMIRMLMIHPI